MRARQQQGTPCSCYALYCAIERLQSGIDWEISIEAGDDIEIVEAGGYRNYLQIKHRNTHGDGHGLPSWPLRLSRRAGGSPAWLTRMNVAMCGA